MTFICKMIIALLLIMALPALAIADWPTYRGDAARSGSTSAQLPFPLKKAWTFKAPQPPKPAWPLPARGSYWQNLDYIEPRIVDDHAFHPVAAKGRVFFASSADDQVYCLDAKTGELKWTYFTDGPVRFAPVIHEEHVLFGSDDGHVYCVGIENGLLTWKQRIAPRDYRVPGNGRLINAWPVRSGIVLNQGTVYATAGIFPSQGVWVVALDAKTGELKWKKKKSFSPQGYLLASSDRLFIPTGRSTPVAINLATGDGDANFGGNNPGTFAIVVEDALISGRGNDGSLTAADTNSRGKIINFSGRHLTVAGDRSFILGNEKLTAINRKRYLQLSRRINELGAKRNQLNNQQKRLAANSPQRDQIRKQIAEVSTAIDQANKHRANCLLWEVPAEAIHGMIVAGNAVIAGGDDVVTAYRLNDGKVLWRGAVDGKAFGFAADDGRLIVTTDKGNVHVFSKDVAEDKVLTRRDQSADASELVVDTHRIIDELPTQKGYCVIVGAYTTLDTLVRQLIVQTDFTIVVIDRDEKRVASARKHLAGTSLYGSRIAVHHVDTDKLPFTDYFANVVLPGSRIEKRDEAMYPREELERILRPNGGYMRMSLFNDVVVTTRPALEGAGEWTHLYANPANTASTEDSHITANVLLQWFGGPGPRRMIDRHLRGPAPLYADGRMFIIGENVIVGVDAYNGTELWELELPKSQRYSMPFDGGYIATDGQRVYAAVNDEGWVIDAKSGKVVTKISVDNTVAISEPHWGYLAVHDGSLFGSSQKSTASRTSPSRELIDSDYRSAQPMVTSRGLFRMNLDDESMGWQYGKGVIINSTITIAHEKVYFIESRNKASVDHETGRIPLPTLAASDLYLVALDEKSGDISWEREIDLKMCRNILYLCASEEKLVVLGSRDAQNKDAYYELRILSPKDGSEFWRAEHPNRKPNELFHGEQVHHPVILGDILVAEPMLYDINTGKPFNPNGGDDPFYIVRPGHSCGTMSGAGDCLFFRANNPTMMNLGEVNGSQRFQTLAPTRAGCWINIIPAGGLVLIPEASASCVCHYSLQTSMAFRPIRN